LHRNDLVEVRMRRAGTSRMIAARYVCLPTRNSPRPQPKALRFNKGASLLQFSAQY